MRAKKLSVMVASILATIAISLANVIPIPPEVRMPSETLSIEIQPIGDSLRATFTGEFAFDHISPEVVKMMFPIPPDANNISVCVDGAPEDWQLSGELFMTGLPEMPEMPLIEWYGPFPESDTVQTVEYTHRLIERSGQFIYFYPFNFYWVTHTVETVAAVDVLLPADFAVKGVWLDGAAHEYEIVGSHLMLTETFSPSMFSHSLVISLVHKPRETSFLDFAALAARWLDADCNEPDWCGGADRSCDGVVDAADIGKCADDWLKFESGQTPALTLSRYYVEHEASVEPNAPGYTLPLDLETVENYAAMDSVFGLGSVTPLLEQNGFAVIEYYDYNDIVQPYKDLRRMDVPLFVTSDTLLHLYHVQFDETLKDMEEREFYGDARALTAALLDNALELYGQYSGDLQEAARRNIAYLAVAQKLIQPTAPVPDLVSNVVANELAKIDAHAGFAESDIFIYREDYSQYVPRGHYTRSEELKRYFRTLMWYGRMAFLLRGAEIWGPMGEALISVYDAKIQTMQAVLLARAIDTVQVGQHTGREIWQRMYAVTCFYVGLADDLTPYEYLAAVNKVFGSGFEPTDLENEDSFFALKAELALQRSPKINGGTGKVFITPPITPESLDELLDKTKGMRFMGQRFIPDSYMFQHLVFPEVLNYTGSADPLPFTCGSTGARLARCYPRGLDVMAILGSDLASEILTQEGDTDYVDYALRFGELKAEFDAFDLSDWNRNLYWGWLYSLRALIEGFGDGYPNFMRTEAWQKKELNATLASWTELRHDTILYAKQSYTPPESIPPDVAGYVEPVPEFYGRLLALTRMTREGLADLDALSAEATERLINLEQMLDRLIQIANKELTNRPLSSDDCDYIRGFAGQLEGLIMGVKQQGLDTTLVADVHTHIAEGQVLEEGVGYVDLIIVACPLADGSAFLAAGPVLSYYEFKHPMSDRLTDEAWRELLDSPQRPERPKWYQSPVP